MLTGKTLVPFWGGKGGDSFWVPKNWLLSFLRNAGFHLITGNTPIVLVALISGHFDCLGV